MRIIDTAPIILSLEEERQGAYWQNRLSEDPSVIVLLLERGTVLEQFLSSSVLASSPAMGLFPHKKFFSHRKLILMDKWDVFPARLSKRV